MVRNFQTHKIRKCKELSSCLWDFQIMDGTMQGEIKQVYVPSCWENYPGTEAYRGKATYSRTFYAKGNIRLEFKGVSHTATVLVDEKEVMHHYNAYTNFDVILQNLQEGEHSLKVIADNSFGTQSALHVPNDYQSYGGISRPVVMEELQNVYIQWLHFTPVQKDNNWYGDLEIKICNLCMGEFYGYVEVNLEKDRIVQIPVQLKKGEEKIVKANDILCQNVESWCPEKPNLYYVNAVLYNEDNRAQDDLIERIGFREIRVEGTNVLLNGKKLFVKGFCRHEDHPQFGCALPQAAMQQDIMLIKELGGNSVRTTHYPNDELFLDLCDEQGILVWEENHARGLSEEDMRNPYFEQQCESCIREMITSHYNHPCIYIWGILNECASHTEYGRMCYEKQYQLIKELDKSRLRSSASCQFKSDICFGYPEVVSYNVYPLWYHNTNPKEYIDGLYQWIQSETEGKGKPFYISEIGAGGIYGYRHPSKVKWTEEYQAEALEKQIRAVFDCQYCGGIYIWQLFDTRVSDSWFATRPKTRNNKGIFDEYRRAKLSYDVVRNLYHSVGNYKK